MSVAFVTLDTNWVNWVMSLCLSMLLLHWDLCWKFIHLSCLVTRLYENWLNFFTISCFSENQLGIWIIILRGFLFCTFLDIFNYMAMVDMDFREFSITGMTGDYRRVFQRPVDLVWYEHFSWCISWLSTNLDNTFFSIKWTFETFVIDDCRELLTYTDDNIPLAETDLDVISKTKPDTAMMNGIIRGNSGYLAKKENAKISLDENYAAEDGNKLSTEIDLPCNSDTPSAKTALKLEFTLPSSCYATMAMRELLKASTSVCCLFLWRRHEFLFS